MKKFRACMASAIAVACFSNTAFAWTPMPLGSCFEAVERGVLVKVFNKTDWYNPIIGTYHSRTDHIHSFYNGQIFDLYYTPSGEAFCEVSRLYQG